MAEEKKPTGKDYFPEVMLFLLFLAMLSLVIYRTSFWGLYNIEDLGSWLYRLLLNGILPWLEIFGLVVTLFAIFVLLRSYNKYKALNLKENEVYKPKHKQKVVVDGEEEVKNGRWERILGLINSANSSDWKLAVVEADIMLDELLRSMSYHGDSVGDMLKSVEPSDFLSLDAAWEAHKVRNKLVHDNNFDLNEREAKHTIALYELVFKEFRII